MKNIKKLIKKYKGYNIYELDGLYIVAIIKFGMAGQYTDYSNKFLSIRKCKDFINYLRGE